MATVNVTIRMDEKLKAQAEELFSDFGLTFNSAMTLFVRQSVREQRIPFEIRRNPVITASDDVLDAISEKIIERNKEAYKELAK